MDAQETEKPETVTTNLPIPKELYVWIKEQSNDKGTYLRREMISVMEDGRKYREKRR